MNEPEIVKPEEKVLLIPDQEAQKQKQEMLEAIRAWKKRRDRKLAKSRFGEPQPVVCHKCKASNTTLYNAFVEDEKTLTKIKICGSCRGG